MIFAIDCARKKELNQVSLVKINKKAIFSEWIKYFRWSCVCWLRFAFKLLIYKFFLFFLWKLKHFTSACAKCVDQCESFIYFFVVSPSLSFSLSVFFIVIYDRRSQTQNKNLFTVKQQQVKIRRKENSNWNKRAMSIKEWGKVEFKEKSRKKQAIKNNEIQGKKCQKITNKTIKNENIEMTIHVCAVRLSRSRQKEIKFYNEIKYNAASCVCFVGAIAWVLSVIRFILLLLLMALKPAKLSKFRWIFQPFLNGKLEI